MLKSYILHLKFHIGFVFYDSISREEREGAMRIRTLADILDYIEALQKKRAEDGGGA